MMNNSYSFQRFTAVVAIISFFSALASDLLQGIPLHFNSDVMADPTLLLSMGMNDIRLLRWGLILDMLGYYLPLLPVVLFIQYWQQAKNPGWVRLYTVCGLGYIFIGAIGA